MNQLRNFLPILQKIHYFNYAKMGPLLTPAAETMKEMIELAREPFELHKEKWLDLLNQTRRAAAELIQAIPEEIALTDSTSSGLSLIAASIQWKKGDRILYPSDEYPSNRFVWDHLETKGVVSEGIYPNEHLSFFDQLRSRDLSKVKLIAVSAVSFWDGRYHDLERIGHLCKRNQILFSVDAIQAAGVIPLDVKTCNIDFLASGGQKWLFGPMGTGFVYFRKERIDELYVPRIGWGSYKPLNHIMDQRFEFAEGAKRFETGYSDLIALIGLGSSMKILKKIGWEKIGSHIRSLVEYIQKELIRIGLPPASKGPQSGIVAVSHRESDRIHASLENKKIYTTNRGERLRFSIHASTTKEEIDFLISSLSSLI